MILIEIDGLSLSSGQLETWRFSDRGLATKPTDSPANVYFEPRLKEGMRSSRRIPLGALGGQPQATFGDIVLENIDGGLDGLAGYAFDGRPFRVWFFDDVPAVLGLPGTESFRGLVGQPLVGYDSIRFRVLDLMPVWFTRPVLDAVYAGTNSGGNGVEGEVDDLMGQRKPRLYGSCVNVRPRLVNRTKLIYQVSDRPATLELNTTGGPSVFDLGVVIAKDAAGDYASLSALEASAPAAGCYRQYSGSEGLFFRLGSAPSEVTCDCSASGSSASTPQGILVKLMADLGLPADQYLPFSPPTGGTPICGLYVEDESTALDVIRQVCPVVNYWYGFDRLNRFTVGRINALPMPVMVIERWDVLELDAVNDGVEGGAPIRSVQVPYLRLHTLQKQVAGAAIADRRALVSEPVRYFRSTDATVKAQRLLALDLELDVNARNLASATSVAGTVMASFGVARQRFDLTIQCSATRLALLDVGKRITLIHPRFGLAVGKDFVIVGIEAELGSGVSTLRLSLWG